jgi:hypothetical protein
LIVSTNKKGKKGKEKKHKKQKRGVEYRKKYIILGD